MKITFFFTLILLFCVALHAQSPDCQIFRTGKFQNRDGREEADFIKRGKKFQIEKAGKLKVKLRVEWIDDCSYKLTIIKGNKAYRENASRGKDAPALIVRITKTNSMSYWQESYIEGRPDDLYESLFIILD